MYVHSVSIDIKIYSIIVLYELFFIGKLYDICIWPETFIK